MANKFYPAVALTGGGTGALDKIDGMDLSDLDAAMVVTGNKAYFYTLDDSSGASESSPGVISPDTNAGNKRWILKGNALIGDYKGNWAASTAYVTRELVKDTSNNNIYYCNTSHTSSGSQPINTNTDSAKWDLIVDAAAAATSATAAATSATAAATSATAAAASETAAETAETNAETAETNAETAETNAETAKTAAETAETNAETAETNASTSASAASTSASAASTSASAASTSASAASTSASAASNAV
jgi:chemotaxis protein histidine kinase CheA